MAANVTRGHAKKRSSSEATERWAREKAREETAKAVETAAEALHSLADTGEAQETAGVASQTDLTDFYDMQKQHQRVIDDLTLRLTQRVLLLVRNP